MTSPTLRPVNLWALVSLAVALLGSVGFIVYGVRLGLSPMFDLAVVGAIFNLLLLVYVLLGPLSADRELRGAYFSFFLQNCFFIAGAFALADVRFKTAALAVTLGGITYFLETRKRFSRLRRRGG